MGSPRSVAARVVDAVAEATVVPSFSRLGIRLRSRLENWEAVASMAGQVVLVTGGTSGIGLAAATAMAELGAAVHLVGRDPARGRSALAAVAAAGRAPVRLDLLDMGDVAEVASFGERFSERYERLDALIHNAGGLSRAYRRTEAGVEVTVASQVLGPYVLTAALAALLGKSAPARIVTVSSGGMYTQRFDLGRLEMQPSDYDGVVAYPRCKRAAAVLADAWGERLGGAGVASYVMHPGWVDTPGLQSGLPAFRALSRVLLRTPAEGADTVVWLAAGGAAREAQICPGVFHDRRRRKDHRFPVSQPTWPGDAEALIGWCAARTGIDPPRWQRRS